MLNEIKINYLKSNEYNYILIQEEHFINHPLNHKLNYNIIYLFQIKLLNICLQSLLILISNIFYNFFNINYYNYNIIKLPIFKRSFKFFIYFSLFFHFEIFLYSNYYMAKFIIFIIFNFFFFMTNFIISILFNFIFL